jgi:hypothetical protein
MQRSNAPVGKRLDEQLALTYEKVRRNGSMGMQSLEFVASHFNISHDAVHRVCRRYHQEEMQAPSFALTFPQFTRIMRETLGKTGGGDLQHGTVDQARGLARSFTIYDATATTPGRLRTANLRLARKPIKEVEDTSWGPVGDDGGSRGFTPLDTGLATPRRLKTASFLPPTLNLTWSARRPNLCEGARDSHFLFANVPRNVKSSHSKLLSNMWQSEYMDLGKFYSEETDFSTAGEYVPASKFHEHTKFETEANEIGRANRRLKTGHLLEPPVRHPADPRGNTCDVQPSSFQNASPVTDLFAHRIHICTHNSLGQAWRGPSTREDRRWVYGANRCGERDFPYTPNHCRSRLDAL